MTQENKELLQKDLCARLPYGVMADVNFYDATKELSCDLLKDFIIDEKSVRPYLRPMSGMTEEEKEEYKKVCELDTKILSKHPMDGTPFPALYNSQDWLNANHFDYRGLIPKGLALEAPKDMYNTWTPLRSGLKENKDGDIVGGLKTMNYRDYPCESKSVDYLDVRLAVERDTKMIIQEAETSHKDNFDEFYDRDSIKPDKIRLFFDENKSPIFGMVIYKIHQKKDGHWRSACGSYYPIYKNEFSPHPYQESICW